MKHAHLAAALLVAFASTTFANPTTRPAGSAPKDRVEQLIEQLGADDFRTRAAAAVEIRKLGLGVLPALKNVKRDDPEIASWCAALVEHIDPTPRPEIAQLVARDGVIRVLDGGGLIRIEIEQPVGNRAARAEVQRMQRLLQVRQLQLDEAKVNVKKFVEIEGEMLELNRKLEERVNLRLVAPRLVEPPAPDEPAQPDVRDGPR